MLEVVASPSRLIRVVVADDHRVVRTGLNLLLSSEPDMTVVGEAGTADEALAVVERLAPDVLLLDLNMPGRPSLEILPDLRERHPDTRIVVLTMQSDPSFARAALNDGVAGYVLKEAAEQELKRAIHAAVSGQTFLSPSLGARMAITPQIDADEPLSPREIEVLRLVALGHTNAEVGELLDISVRTVESHRVHISQKLGCGTRAELVRHALDRQLLD